MIFFVITLIGMYIGRRLGWFFSKQFLYTTSFVPCIIFCALWGIGIAFCLHLLIFWQEPNIFLKSIMGYAMCAYIAIPNFKLINENTIQESELPRHLMIKTIPLVSYIVFAIFFAYFK